MLRSNAFQQLASRSTPVWSSALVAAKPASVVLVDKLWGQVRTIRPFSTQMKRQQEQLHDNDAFDESDALEVGKKAHDQTRPSPPRPAKSRPRSLAEEMWNRHTNIFHHHSLWPGFDDPWTPFARASSIFDESPWTTQRSHRMPVIHKLLDPAKSLLRSSPGYEIKESEGTYEIALDIPEGVRASDMNVHLVQDGTVLHVTGKRHVQDQEHGQKRLRFDQRFTIGPNVDTEHLTANFSDGVLVVKAPKMQVPDEIPQHTITITERPHDISDEEVTQKNYSDAFDESDWAETGKQAKSAQTNL